MRPSGPTAAAKYERAVGMSWRVSQRGREVEWKVICGAASGSISRLKSRSKATVWMPTGLSGVIVIARR